MNDKEKVVCVDDTKQPPGGELKKDKEYIVLESFVNFADQRVYILDGVNNTGRTKFGLPWLGYRANRFKSADSMLDSIYNEEVNYTMN
jgi:hypothetical protein